MMNQSLYSPIVHFIKSSFAKSMFTILLLGASHAVFSHGTVTSPASRVWNCYQENPENPISQACIDAVASHGSQALYDWNEINQGNANGQHMVYVMNGNLPSGGRPIKYGGMDQVRPDWVATSVASGPYTVTWTNSAPHATAYYRVYITKAGWTPNQVLTWEDLELLVETPPSAAASNVDIPVVLPSRTGKHMIYSIWQRSDSPEAFYSTSDIDFGTPLFLNELKGSSASLSQNYPNPVETCTNIAYSIKVRTAVTLKVYNVLGNEVSSLVNETNGPGDYNLLFKRENLPDGLYFYVLKAGDVVHTKRMILTE